MVSRDFFFNDTASTEIYTLSLHDALPICLVRHSLYLAPYGARTSSSICSRCHPERHLCNPVLGTTIMWPRSSLPGSKKQAPALCGSGQAPRDPVMKRLLHRIENDERSGPSRATRRPQTDRTASNHRGRGVLDRWIDFGGAVGGAWRIGLFPGRRRGLYARRPAAADGHSR